MVETGGVDELVARGNAGTMRFDGEVIEVFYDSGKVRRAELSDIARVEFETVRRGEGSVLLHRSGGFDAEHEPAHFGLKFDRAQQPAFLQLERELARARGGAQTSIVASIDEPQIPGSVPPAKPRNWLKIGCLGLIGAFASVMLLGMVINAVDPEGAAERAEARKTAQLEEEQRELREQRAAEAENAEERRSGLHCLSGWDGSNSSAVRQVEAMLRNPDSFEHVETRIQPLDETGGEHGAFMTYRAENGFGGMNVESIYMRIDNGNCEARLLPGGPGSG